MADQANLDELIEKAIAALYSGQADPRTVLKNFADRVRGPGAAELVVYCCAVCKAPNVRCPGCKAAEVAQEKLLNPLLAKAQELLARRAGGGTPG